MIISSVVSTRFVKHRMIRIFPTLFNANIVPQYPHRTPRLYASSLDIPVARLKDPVNETQPGGVIRLLAEGISQHVRVAPWGPRSRKAITTQPATMYEQEAESVPATDRDKLGQIEVSSDQFLRIGRILRSYGVDNKEIEAHPGIFAVKPDSLEDALETFKECGWEAYTADMVIYSWVLLGKMPAKVVVNSDSFSVSRSILRSLLTQLDIEDAAQQDALDLVTESTATYLTLNDLRAMAAREYVRTIFQDPKEAQLILGHVNKRHGPCRPIKAIQRQFNYIMKDLGISKEKILIYPNILWKSDRGYKELLTTRSNIYGLDLRVLAMHTPEVVVPWEERLAKLESALANFNISSFQFSRNLNLLKYSPETVERRLTAIRKDPDLWRFKEDPDFLFLVSTYNDVMRRLSFLRSINVSDIALNLLICDKRRFHRALTKGAIPQSKGKKVSLQHFLPVSALLKLPVDQVKRMIREQLKTTIPPFTALDADDMQRVIDCLVTNGFTNEHFLNCMSIWLYPSPAVEKHVMEVLSDSALTGRRNQPNFLHYVLYAIEKQTNFGGPQAWSYLNFDPELLQDEANHGEEGRKQLNWIRGVISQNVAAGLAEMGMNVKDEAEDSQKGNWFE